METKTMQAGQPEQSQNEPLRTVTAEGFAIRLQKFEQCYLWLVIGCGCGCALAILIAVMLRVWGGLLLAILVAIAYRVILTDLLKKHLGLSCRRNPDGVAVSVVSEGLPWEELWIPRRLLWLDVTELEGAADVKRLHLPRSLRRIGSGEPLARLEQLLYEGSAEEWAAVKCDALPEDLAVAYECAYPPRPVKERKKNSLTQ